MPSQPQSSAGNDRLIHDKKSKQQAESSWTTGADAMTVEEREDEREALSLARPGGVERVVNEQRLPAEGIGAADGEIRHAFTETAGQDSAVKRMSSGEHAGNPSDLPATAPLGRPRGVTTGAATDDASDDPATRMDALDDEPRAGSARGTDTSASRPN